MAPVTLRGIRKRYDDGKAVIQGVDLDVRDGEFMVFVGPSGCGKSTMLRMIAGLEDITEGELRIGERLANDIPAARRGVAMVFQSYALYPHLTVAENMGFSLKMAGQSAQAIREQVGRVAEVLQLTGVLDRKPAALSGGQRQRVAIGRAIVRSPEVFLFDEPLSNLDAGLRGQMRIELTRLHRELGTTMIYVTHDQTEAMTMGDRIAVFHQGRIEQVGEPMTLYRQPVNRFVARFLGSPRMNLADARAVPGDRGWGLQVEGLGRIPVPGLDAAFAERVAGLGVRPEQLEFAPVGDPGWDLGVEAVERLGDTTLVHLAVPAAAEPWTLKLPGDRAPPQPGDAVRVAPAAGGLYLFDADQRVIHPT